MAFSGYLYWGKSALAFFLSFFLRMVEDVVAWEREHLTDWVWLLWSFLGQGSAGYLVWQCFWDYMNPGICDQKKGGMDLGQQKCVLPINPDCEDYSEGDAESPTVPLFLGWPWNIRARHRWDAQTCDNLEWYLRTLTSPNPHPVPVEAKHLKGRSSCLPVISLMDPAESLAHESNELILFVIGYKEPLIMGRHACKLTQRNLSKHPARLSFLDEKHCSSSERLKTFSLAI